MLFLDYTPTLTSSEMEIYGYISSNLDVVKYLTVRELAELNFVSTTTIIRFCNKFECEGYSEFKTRLNRYIEDKKPNPSFDVDETKLINFLKNTTNEYFKTNLDHAVSLIKDKKFVIFIGLGTSNITSEYGALYFRSLYNLSFNINYPLASPTIAKNHIFNRGDDACVIAVSVSGENTKIINNVSLFKSLGVPIVSITNSGKCTLADLSDVNIPYYISREAIKSADITSQIPAIFIIEKLAKLVASKRNMEINIDL